MLEIDEQVKQQMQEDARWDAMQPHEQVIMTIANHSRAIQGWLKGIFFVLVISLIALLSIAHEIAPDKWWLLDYLNF